MHFSCTCQIYLSQNLCDLLKHPTRLEEGELFMTWVGLVFFALVKYLKKIFSEKRVGNCFSLSKAVIRQPKIISCWVVSVLLCRRCKPARPILDKHTGRCFSDLPNLDVLSETPFKPWENRLEVAFDLTFFVCCWVDNKLLSSWCSSLGKSTHYQFVHLRHQTEVQATLKKCQGCFQLIQQKLRTGSRTLIKEYNSQTQEDTE